MKLRTITATLFAFLLVFLAEGFSQESDSTQTTGKALPQKESVVDENAEYYTNPFQDYNEAYYTVNRLNEQIGLPPTKFNLRTPQATLEHFVLNCRNGNYKDAIHAMNFNLLPKNFTEEDATILAEKLYFVIDQRVNIGWDGLSDRPDGQVDISTATNKGIAGKPRRSIVFGEVKLDNRDIVMRVQRIRYKDYGALWLISANTVENIEPLYEAYGPRKLDLLMPDWARINFLGFPVWKFGGTLVLLLLAFLVYKLTDYIICRAFLKSKKGWIKNISDKLATPAGVLVGTIFFYVTLNNLISLSGGFADIVYTGLIILMIGSITFFISRFIDYLMTYIAENKVGDVSEEENEEARKMLTYISVGRRIVTFLIFIVGGYFIISQFRALERVGISLLASAGVATVILGIAAQNTLGNIFAGLQIALTKPVRVGDTVIIDDDWGNVEEIGFTYMVVRTWDLRRQVVPLKWVISNIFENWSMTSSHQIRPVIIHADYRIDVPKVRSKFKEILENAEDWDEDNPAVLQVVDTTDKSIKLRALCSAKDANSAWNLHCEMREKLVAYICELEDGLYLTRERIDIEQNPLEKQETQS